jgi:molybdenum cofactor biosynthesis protein B
MEHKNKGIFVAVNIAVLTVSDTRTLAEDKSGSVLVERLEEAGHNLVAREILKDEIALIAKKFHEWAYNLNIEFIISTGGTGLTGRDVTPEALAQVSEKDIPGFGELFRMLSYQKIKTSTIQSRASAGVLNGTYIFSLPGSPGACMDAWDDILVHQLDIRHRPCNFVELLPRLKEN